MISEVVIKSNMTFGLWELPSIQCFQYILWFIQSHSPNFLIQCRVNIWSCTVRYEESASQNKSTPVEYTQLLLTVLLVLNLSYEYERVNWYGMPEITFFFFFLVHKEHSSGAFMPVWFHQVRGICKYLSCYATYNTSWFILEV